MPSLLTALVMGFVMAAPFGAVGAAAAIGAMKHRGAATLHLVAGGLAADILVILTANLLVARLPSFDWESVRTLRWLWWPMIAALAGYGVLLLTRPGTLAGKMLAPPRPFAYGLGWTLLANPQNWLGTFAAYAGWKVLGLLPTPLDQLAVGTAAFVGGSLSWALWILLCWHTPKRYHARAEVLAHRCVGALCLLTALAAACSMVDAF